MQKNHMTVLLVSCSICDIIVWRVFIYRNEINAKNVFCHVKCFEKNEIIWKVTRVTVFCQENFRIT